WPGPAACPPGPSLADPLSPDVSELCSALEPVSGVVWSPDWMLSVSGPDWTGSAVAEVLALACCAAEPPLDAYPTPPTARAAIAAIGATAVMILLRMLFLRSVDCLTEPTVESPSEAVMRAALIVFSSRFHLAVRLFWDAGANRGGRGQDGGAASPWAG